MLPSKTTEKTFSWVPGKKSVGWPRYLGLLVNIFLELSLGIVMVLLDKLI